MKNETNYIVWSEIAIVLLKFQKLLQYSEEVLPLFMAFGRHMLDHLRQSISWDPAPNESKCRLNLTQL